MSMNLTIIKKEKLMLELLYDGAQFSKNKKARSGIFRVASELLARLAEQNNVNVTLLVSDKKELVKEYLKEKNLQDKVKILFIPNLHKTNKTNNILLKTRSLLLTAFLNLRYKKYLQKFDFFFSPYILVPPIIYKSKIKTAVIVHDLIPLIKPNFYEPKASFPRKYAHAIQKLNTDIIFFDSSSAKKDFLAVRPDFKIEKTVVNLLGADDKFKPVSDEKIILKIRKKYNIPEGKYILGLSDLNKRKNFPHLLKAFIRFLVNTGRKDVSLVITGPDNPKYQELTKTIEKFSEFKKQIILTGFVDDQDLPALYSGAELFVFPSLYEGFGLPLLEAMSCGTPVVSANNSSLPEVAGDAAIYISGEDEMETALILTTICQDEKLKRQMAKNSLARAKKFSWDKTVKYLLENIKKEVK